MISRVLRASTICRPSVRRAALLLEQGAAVEDTLYEGARPQWLQPIRHTLGVVYLSTRRWAGAERVCRKDLAERRNNGWSLYGLYRGLEEQGRKADVAKIEARFEWAWAGAGRSIVTTCRCPPKTCRRRWSNTFDNLRRESRRPAPALLNRAA